MIIRKPALAENIRSKRQFDLQANPHGFISPRRKNADFLVFFRNVVEQKQKFSVSTYRIWEAIYRHLFDFCGCSCSFKQLDSVFVERFREYLLTCKPNVRPPVRPGKLWATSSKQNLGRNTAKSYFERFTTVVKQAREANYLTADPTAKVEPIKARTPEREFLLIDELQRLAQTVCDIPDNLRRAALFSALTGLRYSDLVNLTWANLRNNPNSGYMLNISVSNTAIHSRWNITPNFVSTATNCRRTLTTRTPTFGG
ncbi:MAG TPA: site-specific integrase [Pyrinomonadaceae bacterium]|nr:site-specific integrase [Pyrinomonadaceae bacterium]